MIACMLEKDFIDSKRCTWLMHVVWFSINVNISILSQHRQVQKRVTISLVIAKADFGFEKGEAWNRKWSATVLSVYNALVAYWLWLLWSSLFIGSFDLLNQDTQRQKFWCCLLSQQTIVATWTVLNIKEDRTTTQDKEGMDWYSAVLLWVSRLEGRSSVETWRTNHQCLMIGHPAVKFGVTLQNISPFLPCLV